MILRRMRSACWITKATNTHSEHIILAVFPVQEWLYERVSMLRCAFFASRVHTWPNNNYKVVQI